MNTTITKLALIATAALALSACAPMTPTTTPGTDYTGPQVDSPVAEMPEFIPPPAPQQQYVVQLTASSSPSKAEGIKNRFTHAGYNAFVSPLQANGRLLHRVQIGYYNDQNEAGMVLAQMRQQFPNDVYVADALVKTP